MRFKVGDKVLSGIYDVLYTGVIFEIGSIPNSIQVEWNDGDKTVERIDNPNIKKYKDFEDEIDQL